MNAAGKCAAQGIFEARAKTAEAKAATQATGEGLKAFKRRARNSGGKRKSAVGADYAPLSKVEYR